MCFAAKSPTTDIQPFQRSPSLSEQEKLNVSNTAATQPHTKNAGIGSTGVSPTSHVTNNTGNCTTTSANTNHETQPRRKLSVPTISSMQINQTLSDCEVTVGKRSSSVTGVSNRAKQSGASVRKVPHSPSDRSVSESPNKRAFISGNKSQTNTSPEQGQVSTRILCKFLVNPFLDDSKNIL